MSEIPCSLWVFVSEAVYYPTSAIKFQTIRLRGNELIEDLRSGRLGKLAITSEVNSLNHSERYKCLVLTVKVFFREKSGRTSRRRRWDLRKQ